MKNLERDRRRKKGAIGSQDGGFRTFERRTGHADGRSATCILVGGADVTVYSVCCDFGSFCLLAKICAWLCGLVWVQYVDVAICDFLNSK